MFKVKKLLTLGLALIMSLSIGTTAFAAEPQNSLELLYPTVVEHHAPEAYVLNLISISSKPRVNGTGIDVSIGNLGVDGLDSVRVSVSATDHPKAQTQTAYVLPLIGKTFKFDIPMTKCDMT